MGSRAGDLRTFELGAPGEMRDRLNSLVLAGEKTATAGLLEDYIAEDEPLEEVGERQALLDSDGKVVAVVVVTRVEVVRYADVSPDFVEDEGEGFAGLEDWREEHDAFWRSFDVQVDDETEVVCLWFEVAADIPPATG